MRIILSLFFLLFASLCSWAQGSFIKGIVTDKNGPLFGAEIIIVETQQKTTTNEKGIYTFQVERTGTINVSAFNFDYQSQVKTIELPTDQSINFELTLFSQNIDEVKIEAKKENDFGIGRLKSVEGTAIYAGKKSEVVVMEDVAGNLATNNSRQVFAKVAGLNIWENDGAGIQLGIGGRGLNPNRVSNFNTRQNGYDMSADALGYPESYYSPPSEAVDRIEIVRGAASLQYGTQFGGFINFKLKDGPDNKPLEVIVRESIGSFGFNNTFASVGGTKGKWKYYGFYQYKTGDGWRDNSEFDVHTAHANLRYAINSKMDIGIEYTYMHYLAHQAGGLTDVRFYQDPQQSIRDRNWFQVDWNLAAINFDYRISNKTTFNTRAFGLIAGRDALGILGDINRPDLMGERNLLVDDFKNYGIESRILHRYKIANKSNIALFGARYYSGFTDRKQGNGSANSDADFTYLRPHDLEHSNYDFPSQNLALFSENIFYLTEKITITPGVRFEYIDTKSEGYYKVRTFDLAGNILTDNNIEDNRSNSRSFVLGGIGVSYKPKSSLEYYANFSQNYRSINFNDMRIVNTNARVDPNLQDETGYTADLGIRGNYKDIISYDASAFLLTYNDRIGQLLVQDEVLFNYYLLRTNISDSRSYGIETFVEIELLKLFQLKTETFGLSAFSNFSVMEATYINSDISAIDGNEVELVAPIIFKTGLAFRYKKLKLNYQYSYTAQQYTDATNSPSTANAVNGIVPAYAVMDLSASYAFKKYFSIYSGVNNLLNNYYFTRRASGYPGPGIIPAEPRNLYLTLQFKW
jgi:Fe(3+) dicitrate transport protein